MELTERILQDSGVRTRRLVVAPGERAGGFLYGWWAVRSAALRLASGYGSDPLAVPLVERFKQEL
jgi:hypothetical protein